MVERFVRVGPARIHVLEREGDPARTVVFLHGLTSAAGAWTSALQALPAGVRGLAYDALGAGYSERAGPRRPIHDSEQAELLLEMAGAQRFAAVGHSWGARACLDAAIRAPDRVEGLLLACPAVFRRTHQRVLHRLARSAAGSRLTEGLAPLLVPHAARREVAGLHPEPDALGRQAGHALARPRALAQGWNDTVGHLDVRVTRPEAARYPEIATPLWVVRGAHDDAWTPPPHERAYEGLLPAEHVEIWPDAGHNAPFEHPARFGALVREFCERVLPDNPPPS